MTEDKVNLYKVPGNASENHEDNTKENSEKEIIEYEIFLTCKIIFPNGDRPNHIRKVIERKYGQT